MYTIRYGYEQIRAREYELFGYTFGGEQTFTHSERRKIELINEILKTGAAWIHVTKEDRLMTHQEYLQSYEQAKSDIPTLDEYLSTHDVI